MERQGAYTYEESQGMVKATQNYIISLIILRDAEEDDLHSPDYAEKQCSRNKKAYEEAVPEDMRNELKLEEVLGRIRL